MSTPTPEERRQSFGANADAYERYRPTYPAAAITSVLGSAPLRDLDLGAGTGLLTRAILRLGHEVVAVEPDPQMRAVLTRSVAGLAGVEVQAGTAESIPLPDRSVDAITVGQAFHWFDLAAALPEMAGVLRPDGRLGIFWNVLDDRVPWVDAVCDITGGEARWSLVDAEPDPKLAPWFSAPEGEYFGHTQTMTLDELIGLVSSWSFVYLRDDRAEILQQVREVITDHPDLREQTQYAVPYLTSTFRAAVR
ncbi:MAG TPA: class I SAM-dependent methyltransferase [Actinomycetes bacterium]|nr:class I SAM-dependent methyltransferase [Actinomycetes bacterium]